MKTYNPDDLVTDVKLSHLIDEITLNKRPKNDIFKVFDVNCFEAAVRAWSVLDKSRISKKVISLYKKKNPSWPNPYLFHDSHHFGDYSWLQDMSWFKKDCLESGNYRKLVNQWIDTDEAWQPLEDEYKHLQKHLDFQFYFIQYLNNNHIPLKTYLKYNCKNPRPRFKDLVGFLFKIYMFNGEDKITQQLEIANSLINFCDETGIKVVPTEDYASWDISEGVLDDWSQGGNQKQKSKALKNFMRMFKNWPKIRLSYTRLLN
jgi:hypothetical protein